MSSITNTNPSKDTLKGFLNITVNKHEIPIYMLNFCDFETIYNFMSVSKLSYQIANEPTVWKDKLINVFKYSENDISKITKKEIKKTQKTFKREIKKFFRLPKNELEKMEKEKTEKIQNIKEIYKRKVKELLFLPHFVTISKTKDIRSLKPQNRKIILARSQLNKEYSTFNENILKKIHNTLIKTLVLLELNSSDHLLEASNKHYFSLPYLKVLMCPPFTPLNSNEKLSSCFAPKLKVLHLKTIRPPNTNTFHDTLPSIPLALKFFPNLEKIYYHDNNHYGSHTYNYMTNNHDYVDKWETVKKGEILDLLSEFNVKANDQQKTFEVTSKKPSTSLFENFFQWINPFNTQTNQQKTINPNFKYLKNKKVILISQFSELYKKNDLIAFIASGTYLKNKRHLNQQNFIRY